MLVHICCSVDSHYFLQKIQEEYPDETLVGFFYDPNIHPYSEYKLRLLDVEYSCKQLGIELIEGPYALEEWLKLVKGLENEPEKGDRCTVCFDNRLETSVKKAIELGHDKFTTTLLISPKKSQDKLEIIGKNLSSLYNCEFIFKDYRSGNGVEMQGKQVKEHNLYRQNYCGCMFGLNAQREQQDKLTDELIYPIGQQIQPESIEERLELYQKRNELKECDIIKQRFLNYRLLNAKVIINKEVVPSYFLFYSTLKGKKSIGRVERVIKNVGYFNRDELKIISLDTFNQLANTNYTTVLELVYNPLSFDDELKLRAKITQNNHFDLSTIIILKEIPDAKVSVFSDFKIYDDVKEVLL
ncbi:epoxyqueuosine reductase QueH [Arcobacter sp. 15-2]|uniref:epoxyqueuosine reductase QueH n=1 Tax=Arcobacter sp. 15-2 TaxID=3374109 RepID=UPI00399D5161